MEMMTITEKSAADVLKDLIEETKDIKPYLASSPTIRRVPYELIEANEKYYKPKIAPIGPYHHRRDDATTDELGGYLKLESRDRIRNSMDAMKLRRLKKFLNRLRPGVTEEMLIEKVTELEPTLRECYEGGLDHIPSSSFSRIMFLDGCFIVELLSSERWSKDERQMADSGSINLGEIVQDLLKHENQLPFSFLESLHEMIKPRTTDQVSLATHALNFFTISGALEGYTIHREEITSQLSINHLVHLVMIALFPSTDRTVFSGYTAIFIGIEHINIVRRSASKLNDHGVTFKWRSNADFSDGIVFRRSNGVLEIPRLVLNKLTASLFSNLLATEKQPETKRQSQVMSYVFFMGRLIKDVDDVQVLRRAGILRSRGFDRIETVEFFRNLTRNTPFNYIADFRYFDQLQDIHYYCESFGPRLRLHAKQAIHNWDPVNGILLFILTFTQTLFSVLGYSPPSNKAK